MKRDQCGSRHDVSVDGRTRRVRCERTVFGRDPHPGMHRAEYAPPVTGPDGSVVAQVASWP